MIETSKENLSINKLVAEKKEIIMVEGDMIVPDSKPDILNTICTSGVVSIYKKEIYDGKVRVDGNINTYIMYMPDGEEDSIRGLNTNLDFSQNIEVQNCKEDMNVISCAKVKSIECKVINGRKIGIKVTLELVLKVYSREDIEVINQVENCDNIQMLKEDLMVNSLVGEGNTKVYAKDNISIDNADNLAEILKANIELLDSDVKVSYNKVLTKAEAMIKLMYLTEDNRVVTINYKIPVVGFIDIQDVSEDNICDVNYEIKNIIIKPNNQEEHSIYVEMEIEVSCTAYENKQINLIQDMYSPCSNINFNQKTIMAMTEKKCIRDTKSIREKVNLKNIDGERLVDVDITPSILNENKINSKILYEGEMNLRFLFVNARMQIIEENAKIPFEYVVDNLQKGETLNTNNEIKIKNQDFIVQEGGDISCNIDFETNTNMYRNANINIIDSIEDEGQRQDDDYSIIIYVVRKGDTLWKIAKAFGSTIDAIARVNGIEDKNQIYPGDKLFIPKFVKTQVVDYE